MQKWGPHIVHPVASIFPPITGDDYNKLVQDIKENGLRDPITIDSEGLVLIDGRNRYIACEAAGVEPRYEKLPESYDELDKINFIVSKNVHRRHLSAGQVGMLGVDLWPEISKAMDKREEARKKDTSVLPASRTNGTNGMGTSADRRSLVVGKPAKTTAEIVGTSTRTIERTKTVKTKDPELAKKVRSGEISLNAAYQEVQNSKPVVVRPEIEATVQLIKDQQSIQNVLPTKLMMHFAELDETLTDIEKQLVSYRNRLNEEYKSNIVASLMRSRNRLDMLAELVKSKEPEIEDFLGENNA